MNRRVTAKPTDQPLAKSKVLIVDDEPAVLITYRLILEQQGYEVAACGTSKEALAAVNAQNFDLILTDYSLEQQHTGFEVIERARAKDPSVPSLLLTGYANQETADRAAAMNVGVLYKPIEIQQFLSETRKALGEHHESVKTGT